MKSTPMIFMPLSVPSPGRTSNYTTYYTSLHHIILHYKTSVLNCTAYHYHLRNISVISGKTVSKLALPISVQKVMVVLPIFSPQLY